MDRGPDNQPLEWSWLQRKLITSGNYWLVTTRADGRPHTRPVWGVFHDEMVWFSTSRSSVKGRNIERDPRCVLHLESGDDVVIIDGRAELVAQWKDVMTTLPARAVIDLYMQKYAMSEQELAPEGDLSRAALYRVRPTVINAWLEGAYPTTQSRWSFDTPTEN